MTISLDLSHKLMMSSNAGPAFMHPTQNYTGNDTDND